MVSKVYGGKWYLRLGENLFAEFIPDVSKYMIPVMFIQSQFGWRIPSSWLLWLFIGMMLGFLVMGYLYKHSGLYEAEVFTGARKNPYSAQVLRLLRDIDKNTRGNDDGKRQNRR